MSNFADALFDDYARMMDDEEVDRCNRCGEPIPEGLGTCNNCLGTDDRVSRLKTGLGMLTNPSAKRNPRT